MNVEYLSLVTLDANTSIKLGSIFIHSVGALLSNQGIATPPACELTTYAKRKIRPCEGVNTYIKKISNLAQFDSTEY